MRQQTAIHMPALFGKVGNFERKNGLNKIEGITKDGEVVPLSRGLGLRGRVLQVGWELPSDLTEDEWKSAGELLGKVERSVSWWLGDWWAFGEAKYGERKALVDADGWDGPSFESCQNAASVCRAFQTSRRREALSFSHHADVMGLPASEADALLDWCEETIKITGKPRSTRELRGEACRRRSQIGERVSSDTCTLEDLSTLIASGKRFGAIYADPPWSFKVYSGKGKQRSADRYYDTQSLDDIKALPVSDLAEKDCALFMWAVMPELPGALEVIRAWGFEYKTVAFTWVKQNKSGNGLFWGMGYWTRANAEVCLLATRGSPKRIAMDVHQIVMSPVSEHSRKPDEVQVRIERLVDGPYLELYGRRPSPKWTVWGNQISRNLFQQEIPEFVA